MRLINTKTYELHEFFGDQIPAYAILSHTWSDREITFGDWADRAASGKDYQKIRKTCQLASRQGYDYVWVDTNCIDKSSSAELTEAINSMFMWYKMAKICYAYLVDVPLAEGEVLSKHLARSRWFTRGWTLQELLAPREIEFYSHDWVLLGTKDSLCSGISSITGIADRYISQKFIGDRYFSGDFVVRSVQYAASITEASVAERLSWLSRRTTTRAEDMAYCILGIFDINMPLLYGEGPKAFIRLQEEIMKVLNDSSLFCWTRKLSPYMDFLSPSPSCFQDCSHFIPGQRDLRPTPYFMTNAGLSMTLPILRCWSSHHFIGILQVESSEGHKTFGVPMAGDLSSGKVCRTSYPPIPIPLSSKISTKKRFNVFISENYSPIRSVLSQSKEHAPDDHEYRRNSMSLLSRSWD
ncbi:hypothetical protein CHU98_g10174 [Xylaria longipes]|nr:hypothetical protein CHU98_g10174 [Xylaria longipes]